MESWKREPAAKRAAILARWHDLLVTHASDLAALLTAEQGKPLAEALAEFRAHRAARHLHLLLKRRSP